MKVYLVFGFVFLAVIVITLSQRCIPDDLSACSGMSCTGRDTAIGCVANACTCVLSYSCDETIECSGKDLGCEHGMVGHCVDGKCTCLRDEQYAHGP